MLIDAKLTVDIAGTIVTLQAFGKVVGQIADEDLPSEEGLLTAPPFALTVEPLYNGHHWDPIFCP